jgi:ferric-dicitrate binding protein FerR (iron transport regulator)
MAESRQWYCAVNGQRFGPVSDQELAAWIQQGRLKPADLVWCEGMAEWQPMQNVRHMFPAIALPPTPPGQAATASVAYSQPHRGGVVLALGIVGIVACWICGAVAWSMGNKDMAAMRAGVMDPTGEGMTQAGRICGMVGTILGIVGCGIAILYIIFMVGIFGVAAAGGNLH